MLLSFAFPEALWHSERDNSEMASSTRARKQLRIGFLHTASSRSLWMKRGGIHFSLQNGKSFGQTLLNETLPEHFLTDQKASIAKTTKYGLHTFHTILNPDLSEAGSSPSLQNPTFTAIAIADPQLRCRCIVEGKWTFGTI